VALAGHPNGHERERALQGLVPSGEARALPFILLRLNDWVPQVRAVAMEALEPYLNEAKAPALMAHLGLLRQVTAGSRVPSQLWSRVSELLVRPALAPALRAAFEAGDKACKLAILALEGDLDRHLVYEATVRGAPAVQMAAAARMLASPAVYREALQELESSRVPGVRALVLQPRLPKAGLADRVWLRALLVDRSWRLRARARARWKELGLEELRSVYLTASASPFPTVRATAATALAEIRAADAPALLQGMLRDPAALVRAAALAALSTVAPDQAEPVALALLGTSRGKELRAAAAVVKRSRQRVALRRS
jgi:hypothetical protein